MNEYKLLKQKFNASIIQIKRILPDALGSGPKGPAHETNRVNYEMKPDYIINNLSDFVYLDNQCYEVLMHLLNSNTTLATNGATNISTV